MSKWEVKEIGPSGKEGTILRDGVEQKFIQAFKLYIDLDAREGVVIEARYMTVNANISAHAAKELITVNCPNCGCSGLVPEWFKDIKEWEENNEKGE